jgi:hypothetical protein
MLLDLVKAFDSPPEWIMESTIKIENWKHFNSGYSKLVLKLQEWYLHKQ